MVSYRHLREIQKEIKKIESFRSRIKADLHKITENQCLTINSMVTEMIKCQRTLSSRLSRIQELRAEYRRSWKMLSYEDQVRYRYWIHGVEYPNDTASEKLSEAETHKKEVVYYRIDRENAKKLIDKLIDFLSGDEEFFKVGLNESDAS
jgi:hypothetical protein